MLNQQSVACFAGLALLLFSSTLRAEGDAVWVGQFRGNGNELPAPWTVKQIDSKVPATRYQIREWEGQHAVEGSAEASMALLGRPVSIDLEKTPILCWQWRVDHVLKNADMRTKAGDDYAARLYLTFRIPEEQLSLGTRTKLALARSIYGDKVPDAALNYVWDNHQPPETLMDNAYTDRTRMLVLRSGNQDAGHWVTERRDVRADFARAFKNIQGQLSGVAVAVDTDNTGEKAKAGFAGIHFVPAGQDCRQDSK